VAGQSTVIRFFYDIWGQGAYGFKPILSEKESNAIFLSDHPGGEM